jgi:adenylate kinase
MLGPPGAGKGTQAVRLAEHFGCADIATGDIFRANVAEGTGLGRIAQEYMDRGDLVPDQVVISMVMARLAEPDCSRGFVLDGFPRTVAQAEALDARLAQLGTPLDAALNFEITEEELLRRLAGRAAQLHRSDDSEQTIRHRLEVFAIKTRPLIDYYAHRSLLVNVDAIGPVEVVTKRILDDLTGLAHDRDVRPDRLQGSRGFGHAQAPLTDPGRSGG